MEIAQVGVTTRARARALTMAADGTAASESLEVAKKRKVSSGELLFASNSHFRSRGQKQVTVTPENSVSPVLRETVTRRSTVNEEVNQSTSPSSSHVQTSCCSSNGSSERDAERISVVDLEQDEIAEVEISTYCCPRERREETASSKVEEKPDQLELTTKSSEADSQPKSSGKIKPTESEIEEFFVQFGAHEKNLQRRFSEKYNYDIIADEPLEGRYEWVPSNSLNKGFL